MLIIYIGLQQWRMLFCTLWKKAHITNNTEAAQFTLSLHCSLHVSQCVFIQFKLFYFTSFAKQSLSLYYSISMSASWRHNQYSRRVCGKVPKLEAARHGTRTRDIWYERPTLCHCTNVLIYQYRRLSHKYEQICQPLCYNLCCRNSVVQLDKGYPCLTPLKTSDL